MPNDRDQRHDDIIELRAAYAAVDDALKRCSCILRRSEAGKYMWAAKHKTVIAGMRATLRIIMERALPDYR